jgi:hypothetical protein
MSDFDFNSAEPQRGFSGELIPENTIVLVVATIRPGQEGPGGYLKANNDRSCLMADFEFTIDGGEFDRRKVWGLMVTAGETEGQQKAAAITRSRLRAMLESAHGILPSDNSAPAVARRQVAGWEAFDGLKFCARIGVEKGGLKDKTAGPNSERWPDKNVVYPVTPEDERYISPGAQNARGAPRASVAQTVAAASKPATNGANGAAKPAWAS